MLRTRCVSWWGAVVSTVTDCEMRVETLRLFRVLVPICVGAPYARKPMIWRASSTEAIGRPTDFAICTTRSTRSALQAA